MTHISLPSERYVLPYLYIISTILPYIIDISQQPSLCLKYSFLRCKFYSGSNVPWGGGAKGMGGKRHGGQKTGGQKAGGKRHVGQKVGGQKTGGQKTGGQKTGAQKTGGQKS